MQWKVKIHWSAARVSNLNKQPCSFKKKIKKTELGTSEWDTINPDCLIRISNVNPFDFLDIVQKNQKPVF